MSEPSSVDQTTPPAQASASEDPSVAAIAAPPEDKLTLGQQIAGGLLLVNAIFVLLSEFLIPADPKLGPLFAPGRSVMPAIIDLAIGVSLLRGKPKYRTWALVRVLLGTVLFTAAAWGKDPLMTAKVLQVINSASFALGRQINDVCEAVMYLGMGRTRALLLMAGTFSQFETTILPGFSPEQIWNHSLQVATLAQIISLEETSDAKLGEAAFTSGLMHDMGKLILAANVPAMCAAVEQLQQRKQLSRREAELQVLGTTHAELAACLLGTWGLPLPVLEAVAWHHCPARSGDVAFTPLTAVHAANVFSAEMGSANAETVEGFDHEYLLQVGLGDRRNAWRETCGLAAREEEDAEHKRARLRLEAKLN